MNTNKNIPYYLTTVGLFVLLKFWFTSADNNDLIFLLKPTDKLVGLLTGSHSVYLSDSGYYHEKLNILIEKSCSGFNFWVLCFLLFTYLALKYFDKPFHKIIIIPITLVSAYLLSILVNTARIFVSVVVQHQAGHFLPDRPHLILHEAVGIVTNLTFLILAYYLIEKLLIYKRNNEKFT